MIKISIEYEGSASRFRRELMELLGEETVVMEVQVPKMNRPANEAGVAPSAPVDGDRLEVPEGIRVGDYLIDPATPERPYDIVRKADAEAPKEAEQPVRKKRRSKAEMEAAASPEPPQAAEQATEEPTPDARVSNGVTYWLDNDKAEVFVLQDGEALPDADLIADKAIEQLTDEAEFKLMQERIKRLNEAEEAKGPASKLEAEVEKELEVADGDTVMKVAGRLLEVFEDEVDAAAAITDTVTKVGKAAKIRDVAPENAPAVIKELKRLIKAEQDRIAAKAEKRGRR